jgi:hypothetical protein
MGPAPPSVRQAALPVEVVVVPSQSVPQKFNMLVGFVLKVVLKLPAEAATQPNPTAPATARNCLVLRVIV